MRCLKYQRFSGGGGSSCIVSYGEECILSEHIRIRGQVKHLAYKQQKQTHWWSGCHITSQHTYICMYMYMQPIKTIALASTVVVGMVASGVRDSQNIVRKKLFNKLKLTENFCWMCCIMQTLLASHKPYAIMTLNKQTFFEYFLYAIHTQWI